MRHTVVDSAHEVLPSHTSERFRCIGGRATPRDQSCDKDWKVARERGKSEERHHGQSLTAYDSESPPPLLPNLSDASEGARHGRVRRSPRVLKSRAEGLAVTSFHE